MMFRRWIIPVLILATSLGIDPALAFSPSVHRLETSPDGQFVTEMIEFQQPSAIKLSFAFCPIQRCGDLANNPSSACRVDRWVPQFGNDLLNDLIITPPASGATAEKLFLKTGSPFNVPSHYGYWEPGKDVSAAEFDRGTGIGAILSELPSYTSSKDDSLTLNIKSPLPSAILAAFTSEPGNTCGVSEELANEFGGQTVDNFYATRIKIAVVWKLRQPSGIVNTRQTIEVNGQSQTTPASFGTPATAKVKTQAAVLRDILAKVTPSSATAGLSGKDLLKEINLQGYTVDRPTDLGNVTARLANGEPAIAWVTTMIDKKSTGGVILVTSYNSSNDRFLVMDVETGKTSAISYNQFMNQNPGFSFLTKKGAQ